MSTKPTHAQIELARIQRELEEAAKRHRGALTEAQKIRGRIAEAQQRQAEITRNRVAGNSNPDEAGEFIMLQHDIEALQLLQAEAEARAAELLPTREEAACRAAQDAVKREHDQAAFHALSDRLQSLERAFLECLSATHAAGKRIGHVSLGKTWQPSRMLKAAVGEGIIRDWS